MIISAKQDIYNISLKSINNENIDFATLAEDVMGSKDIKDD